MKIKGELYNLMKDCIKILFEKHKNKYGDNDFTTGKDISYQKQYLWNLWHQATFDLMNDDSHPFYSRKNCFRVLPYRANFNVYNYYDRTVNDNHIETALLKIANELNIFERN